jgi:hypothetical protein
MEHDNVHFCDFLSGTISGLPRVVFGRAKISRGGSAMAHRNTRDLDAAHNSAIRKEIGHRLRAQLSRGEQTSPPPRVQDLLDRLSTLDDTKDDTKAKSM